MTVAATLLNLVLILTAQAGISECNRTLIQKEPNERLANSSSADTSTRAQPALPELAPECDAIYARLKELAAELPAISKLQEQANWEKKNVSGSNEIQSEYKRKRIEFLAKYNQIVDLFEIHGLALGFSNAERSRVLLEGAKQVLTLEGIKFTEVEITSNHGKKYKALEFSHVQPDSSTLGAFLKNTSAPLVAESTKKIGAIRYVFSPHALLETGGTGAEAKYNQTLNRVYLDSETIATLRPSPTALHEAAVHGRYSLNLKNGGSDWFQGNEMFEETFAHTQEVILRNSSLDVLARRFEGLFKDPKISEKTKFRVYTTLQLRITRLNRSVQTMRSYAKKTRATKLDEINLKRLESIESLGSELTSILNKYSELIEAQYNQDRYEYDPRLFPLLAPRMSALKKILVQIAP